MDAPDLSRVSQQVTAAVIGITTRQLRTLTNDGTIPTVGKGRYDLAAAVQAYLAYTKRGKVHAENLSIRQAVEEQKRRRLQIENDLSEGLALPREEVERAFADAMTTIAQALDSLPANCAKDLAMTRDAGEIRRLLKDETNRIRNDAADRLQMLGTDPRRRRASKTAARSTSRSVG